jgi:hypothetical protein
MKREVIVTRRQILSRVALSGAAPGLAGCDRLSNATERRSVLDAAENLTRSVQRAFLTPRTALASECGPPDLSLVRRHLIAWIDISGARRKGDFIRRWRRPGQRVMLADWHGFVTLGGFA